MFIKIYFYYDSYSNDVIQQNRNLNYYDKNSEVWRAILSNNVLSKLKNKTMSKNVVNCRPNAAKKFMIIQGYQCKHFIVIVFFRCKNIST